MWQSSEIPRSIFQQLPCELWGFILGGAFLSFQFLFPFRFLSHLFHLTAFSKLFSPQQDVRNLRRFLVLLSGTSYHHVFNTLVPWESNGKRTQEQKDLVHLSSEEPGIAMEAGMSFWDKAVAMLRLAAAFQDGWGVCWFLESLPCREEPIKGMESLPDFERSVSQADFSYIFILSLVKQPLC